MRQTPAVINIRPAVKYFLQRGVDPALLFLHMPCAFFEHHVAAGRSPEEIYRIAFGPVTIRPKADRRQAPGTVGDRRTLAFGRR